MKRIIALVLALILLVPVLPANAAGTDDLRHQVYGDTSKMEVLEEAGLSKSDTNGAQAQIGTDIYLFVDPDTASLVTFYVTDDNGLPLHNAQIYLTYGDKTEFFGTTGINGKFETYLFRDVKYGYTVKLSGYEAATGVFTATKELAKVHVVLRKYHRVEVVVVDKDVPLSNVPVIIDGVTYVTDKNGKIYLNKTNGDYSGVVKTEDGREIIFRFDLNGKGITTVVDVGQDQTLMDEGVRWDNFLVYDRDYHPEDYELTYYQYTEKDLKQGSGETDQEFADRCQRYLQENPSAILVEAQPDRKQNPTGKDTDVLDAKKNPVYTQRSLMPTGYLLKAWEEDGYSQLVFTNEDMGIRLNMADLHSPEITKVFALAWYLTEKNVKPVDICTDDTDKQDYQQTGILSLEKNYLELDDVDMTAIKDFEFEFVHEALEHPKQNKNEAHDLLKDSLFTNTTFEFRLTPITRETLQEMIRNGLEEQDSQDKTTIVIANSRYFRDKLCRSQAEGILNENEADELYQFVVDGRLTADEIGKLKADHEEGKLANSAIDLLLDAAMDEKLYRVSCWAHYRDVVVNITEYLDSMELIRNVDSKFEAIYQQLSKDNKQREPEDRMDEEALIDLTEKKLLAGYQFLLVDDDHELYNTDEYVAGGATALEKPDLIHTQPDKDNEFFNVLMDKRFSRRIADVRLEDLKLNGKTLPRYTIGFQNETARLDAHRAFTCMSDLNALTGLALQKP